MKFSKLAIHRKTHALPELRFEDQQLTSFSGLVVIQQLFTHLDLKERLRGCFRHLNSTPIFRASLEAQKLGAAPTLPCHPN